MTDKEKAPMGSKSELSALLAEHPYYCSESNYYSNEPSQTWETMSEFLDQFENADIDMNLVFRWDVRPRDEENTAGRYRAEVFIMHQRKGIFSPHQIKHINEEEAKRFRKYVEKHWETLRKIWEPISG